MRVLVIDDSRATRAMIRMMLKSFDAEVFEAEHGKAALEVLAAEENMDLALVDWNMPVMNGFEFVTEVRKEDKYNDMLMMMVTTETEMEQVVKAIEAGANEYLMKPFTKDMLGEKLQLLGIYSGSVD